MDLAMLVSFTLEGMLPILIKLVVAGLIAYVALWALGKIGLPEPFNKITFAIIILIAAVYCILLLDKIA